VVKKEAMMAASWEDNTAVTSMAETMEEMGNQKTNTKED
jgi:hypothetical protein